MTVQKKKQHGRFGSGLGNALSAWRERIATKEGTDEKPAADVAQELAEELAQACGVTVEEWGQIEAGTLDPTADQLGKIAEVIGKHDDATTADELAALDVEASAEAAEQLRAQVTELEPVKAEAVTLRSRFAALSGLEATAPVETHQAAVTRYVELGKKADKSRRESVVRRLVLRHGGDRSKVPPEALTYVAKAEPDALAAFEAALPDDPLAQSMCEHGHPAVEYRSSEDSSVTTGDGEAPATHTAPEDSEPVSEVERIQAAHVYRSERREAGDKQITLTEATKFVRTMKPAEIRALAKKSEFAKK